MSSTLIKSLEIDGLQVEIRVSDDKDPLDDKVVAQFIYELLTD